MSVDHFISLNRRVNDLFVDLQETLILVDEIAEYIGCPHPDFICNLERLKSLLPQRLNYTLTVVKTTQHPTYTLSADNVRVQGKSEEIAFVKLLLHLHKPKLVSCSTSFNVKRLVKILDTSSRQIIEDCDDYRDSRYSRRFIDYVGLVFVERYGRLSVNVKKNQDEQLNSKSDLHNGLITVGLNGKWLGEGPWVPLTAAYMDELEQEIRAEQLRKEVAAIENKIKEEAQIENDLILATKILWREPGTEPVIADDHNMKTGKRSNIRRIGKRDIALPLAAQV